MRVRHSILWLAIILVLGSCSDDNETTVVSPPEAEATYTVTFNAGWSASTHPDSFPNNPHFSTLIGATHNASVSFWSTGEFATPGIKNMAERGATFPLVPEITMAVDSSWAQHLLTGGGIPASPGDVSLTFTITPDFPLVTLVSMLAPSPDWFIGVSGHSLLQGNSWVDSVAVELFLYDAGTDSGPSYASPNQATNPPDSISLITGFPALVNGSLQSVGTFIFKKQ